MAPSKERPLFLSFFQNRKCNFKPNIETDGNCSSPFWKRTEYVVFVCLLLLIASLGVWHYNKQRRNEALYRWAAPTLMEPEVITIQRGQYEFNLDDTRDYVFLIPCGENVLPQGITIRGGRNIRIEGGVLRFENDLPQRALYLTQQTGTVDVRSVVFKGDLNEGINLSQTKGATVQLQDILIDHVTGSLDGHHADLLQTWAGPRVLRVHRFRGRTDYQGLFLTPTQSKEATADPQDVALSHIEIEGHNGFGYLYWRDDGDWPLTQQSLTALVPEARTQDQIAWPKSSEAANHWPALHVEHVTTNGTKFIPSSASTRCRE